MSYLDILEKYLQDHNILYEREDLAAIPFQRMERHQITVYDADVAGMSDREKQDHYVWDVICHPGSYGYEQGLLEGMGEMFSTWDVMGHLTVWDVIDFIEGRREPDSITDEQSVILEEVTE